MGKFIDMTGQRFGRLTVICRAEDHVQPNGVSKGESAVRLKEMLGRKILVCIGDAEKLFNWRSQENMLSVKIKAFFTAFADFIGSLF